MSEKHEPAMRSSKTSPSTVGGKSKCCPCHFEYLEIIICTSEKALFRVCRVFVCLTAEGIILHQSQCSSGSSSPARTYTPSSSYSYMTSARLSLTLFLCLVLALKAAELKRCFSNREILLPLTAASRMSGAPRPKMSLSSGLNCTKAKTHTSK